MEKEIAALKAKLTEREEDNLELQVNRDDSCRLNAEIKRNLLGRLHTAEARMVEQKQKIDAYEVYVTVTENEITSLKKKLRILSSAHSMSQVRRLAIQLDVKGDSDGKLS